MEIIIILSVLTIIFFFSLLFTVDQQSAVLIERFGKFQRVAFPGLNWKLPFIEQRAGKLSLRVKQIDVEVETKTLDNVFLTLVTSVQYRILNDKIYEAFYTLDHPEAQIRSFIFDVVRARVPEIKLDDVFSKKDDIANSVQEELKEIMNTFGYNITKTLVTDIQPDSKVKAAMNEINESQRLRIAATERAEAEKILKVKQAEAEAESKMLQGKGMAAQRKAIMEGLKESLEEFQKQIHTTNTQEVMNLILMTQYFDTLKEMSTHGNMNTILLPHSPASLSDLHQQLRDAIVIGHQTAQTLKS